MYRLQAREIYGCGRARLDTLNTDRGFYTNIFPNFTIVSDYFNYTMNPNLCLTTSSIVARRPEAQLLPAQVLSRRQTLCGLLQLPDGPGDLRVQGTLGAQQGHPRLRGRSPTRYANYTTRSICIQ